LRREYGGGLLHASGFKRYIRPQGHEGEQQKVARFLHDACSSRKWPFV
jgi:hypothetical protein